MRNHLQGIALLGLLAAALWGMARLASPALGDAFGEDGAVQADTGDVVDLVVGGETLDAPLNFEERSRLQFHLVVAGFLADTSEVDGDIGDRTRDAIAAAAEAWDLEDPSDREFLIFADERTVDTPLFGTT